MPATKRIASTAGPDLKVRPGIKRVAETNLLDTLRPLGLSGKQWEVMSFLIEHNGSYSTNQKAMSGTLKMSVRTLSWAQRRLAEKGLIDLRYDGRRTHYRIRLEGVEMALKSASSKGYARPCVSTESITNQTVNLKREDTSAEAGGGILLPVPQARIQRRATPPGDLAGAAQPGAHPAFMRGHTPRGGWRDNSNLTAGQRLVELWKELTGRLASPQEKGVLRSIARQTQEPEKLLAWAVRHWNLVGDGTLDWANHYPAEPSLLWLRRNLADYQRAFSMDQRDLQFLASTEAREDRREWRESHHKSDWRDDDSWRTGPNAEEIEDLLIAGKDEEARAMIHALSESWRDGPHADEIDRLRLEGKVKEAAALMKGHSRER